eukprot:14196360-Ditylum_brightwellii.AAC.1
MALVFTCIVSKLAAAAIVDVLPVHKHGGRRQWPGGCSRSPHCQGAQDGCPSLVCGGYLRWCGECAHKLQ